MLMADKYFNRFFLVSLIDQRTTSLFSEVNIFYRNAESDVLFLRGLSNLDNIVNFNDFQLRNYLMKSLENYFLDFLKENTIYCQLIYSNEKGNEIIKISFEVYENSKKIFGKSFKDNYFWVLITVSEKNVVSIYLNNLKRYYLFFLLFPWLITLVVNLLKEVRDEK